MLGKKTGGRKKGSKNKKTVALAAALGSAAEASLLALTGETPLDFMLAVMRSPDVDPATRFDAAKSAAPYLHPKLAAIEHTGKDGGPIETKDLTELELARRLAFILESAARKES